MSGTVIVLHGLALNRWWMAGFSRALEKEGFTVHNVSYPTREAGFAELADSFLKPLLDSLPPGKIHVVAHSMGGLLMRIYAAKYGAARLGRVVMLGTPNGGSEAADLLRENGLFKWFFGPAGQDLGTSQDCLPSRLGPVPFECGVIAGDNSWFHFPTPLIAGIPGPSDGIVSVESTKVPGMKDHATVWADHSLMTWSPKVWRLAAAFLKEGKFPPEQERD